jgi:hypothetical protein
MLLLYIASGKKVLSFKAKVAGQWEEKITTDQFTGALLQKNQ